MRNILLAVVLLFARAAFAQVGSVASVAIETNGWQALVTFRGMATNGAFAYGFNEAWTNHAISGSEKLVLSVTSQGYDDTGTATTIGRTVYGTFAVRFPYPGEAFKDMSVSGTNVTVRIALSEYIFPDCTNITANVGSGFYVASSVTNTAATSVSVSNGSVQPHLKVISEPQTPGFTIIDTGATYSPEVTANHWAGRYGRSVRMVQFIWDDGTLKLTNRVTSPTLTLPSNDAIPFPTWRGSFASTGFGTNSYPRLSWSAYPWIGDASSVFHSTNVPYVHPTPLAAPWTNGVNIARVRCIIDPTNGVNATGVAATESYWAGNTNPAPFLNFGAALSAAYDTNNAQNGVARMDGVILYMKSGTHIWMGSTVSKANAPRVETLITPYPGVTKEQALIGSQGTDTRVVDDKDIYRFKGIRIDSSSVNQFSRNAHVIFEDCFVNSTGSAFIVNAGSTNAAQFNWYLIGCTISNLTQGVRTYSAWQVNPAIVRGNRFNGNCQSFMAISFWGNRIGSTSTTNVLVNDATSGQSGHLPEPSIGYNWITSNRGGDVLSVGMIRGITNGAVIVNNVVEACHPDQGATQIRFCTDPAIHGTNIIRMGNSFIGCKVLDGYQDQGTNVAWRVGWCRYDELYSDGNDKTDIFVGSGGPDGHRIGNWPLVFGVNTHGYRAIETTGIGGAGSFQPEFMGLYGWTPTLVPTMATNWPAFRDYRAFDGGTNFGLRFGNYRFKTESPLLSMPNRSRWVLSHDLDGYTRGPSDPPGAYAVGNARRGSGFFQAQ